MYLLTFPVSMMYLLTFRDSSSELLSLDLQLSSPCNEHCHCTTRNYEPICGMDGVQYFSPCHAGCETMGNEKVTSVLLLSKLKQVGILQPCFSRYKSCLPVILCFTPIVNTECVPFTLSLNLCVNSGMILVLLPGFFKLLLFSG